MFKCKYPKDQNTDGAIYRISHKDVSHLLFGDFDDPAAIENLLDTSAANEKRHIEIDEEISMLIKQVYEAEIELGNYEIMEQLFQSVFSQELSEEAGENEEIKKSMRALKLRFNETIYFIENTEKRIRALTDERYCIFTTIRMQN